MWAFFCQCLSDRDRLTDDNEGYSNHLVLHSRHRFIDSENPYVLTKTVVRRDGQEDGIQQKEHLVPELPSVHAATPTGGE